MSFPQATEVGATKKTGVTNLSSYTSSIYVNLMMLIHEQELDYSTSL